LKIPKGQSESVDRRRTDNIMAKRKSTKGDQQNIHIKLKIECGRLWGVNINCEIGISHGI